MKISEKINPGMALNYVLDLVKEKNIMTVDGKDLVEADLWFGESTIIILTFEDAIKRIELFLRGDELYLEFDNNCEGEFNYKLFAELVNKINSYKQWING